MKSQKTIRREFPVADNKDTTRRWLTEPVIWLCAYGLIVIALGFQLGELAQRVSRASELLTSLTRGQTKVEVHELAPIVRLLENIARDVFASRRWFMTLGLIATASVALVRRAPMALRFGGIGLGLLLVLLLLLTSDVV